MGSESVCRESIRAHEAVQHISIRRQLHASLGVAAMSGKQRQSQNITISSVLAVNPVHVASHVLHHLANCYSVLQSG